MTNATISLILNIAEVIGALGIIYGAMKKFVNKTEEKFSKERNEELSKMERKINDMQISLIRIEILSLIANDPTNHDTIYSMFDEYQKIGGNHYIESVIRKWEREQGID